MSIHFCRTNKFDLEVLIYHLKADALISKESLTPADLDQLKRYTLLWREGFKMSFSRNCDKERDKLTSERSKASESSSKEKEILTSETSSKERDILTSERSKASESSSKEKEIPTSETSSNESDQDIDDAERRKRLRDEANKLEMEKIETTLYRTVKIDITNYTKNGAPKLDMENGSIVSCSC